MNRRAFASSALSMAGNYWWGDWLDVRFYLRERLSRLKDKRVLDVGCGAGILTYGLEMGSRFYGVDDDSKSLKLAKKLNPGMVFRKASMYALPFKDSSFDVVVAANTLPGADFRVSGDRKKLQKAFIDEVVRVLKPGGKLLFSTPNDAHLAYRNGVKATLQEVEGLLSPYFDFEVRGWNPFPP